MSILQESFNQFGTFGPQILLVQSMYLLWNNHNLFFYYTVGIFMDFILNLVLKGLFQQPRPSEDPKMFELALKHGKRFIFKDGMPYDIFGIPSGHSQSSFFSTTFVYLSLRKMNVLYIQIIVTLLTITQRVVYKHHTILQVIAGAFVGIIFGYFFNYLATQKIKGLITEKPDDYGPI
jgi:membrane-associated phospholipid phosphatase